MTRNVAASLMLILPLILSGCQTVGEHDTFPLEQPSLTTAKFSVNIISEPSGVVVEVNDNFVGKTPVTVALEGWKETRTFARRHIVVSHPSKAGGYTQVKTFFGWYEPSVAYGDTIPETIFFNMGLEPVPEKLEVEITK